MNYFELNRVLKDAFMRHLFVNEVYDDISSERQVRDLVYPNVTLNTVEVSVGQVMTTVRVELWYMDRQTEERDNVLQVQSMGISAVSDVLNMLLDGDGELEFGTEYVFTVFRDRFADLCAGAYCTVSFVFPSDMSGCGDAGVWKEKC